MWQLFAYEALDFARNDRAREERQRRLRHPGGIEEDLLHGRYGYWSDWEQDRGPGRIRRTTARLAAAVSHGAAGLARSLDATVLEEHRA